MSRKVQPRHAARPALLGDRGHTRRVADRVSIAAFAIALLIFSPLAYGMVQARVRSDQTSLLDATLVSVVVVAAAFAVAFVANIAIHFLGREARARRGR